MDVPFYLRSGKAMSCRTTQIVIQFREPPHLLFGKSAGPMEANRLLIQVQPAEGIQLLFQSKTPDAGMRLRNSALDFRFYHGDPKKDAGRLSATFDGRAGRRRELVCEERRGRVCLERDGPDPGGLAEPGGAAAGDL
jgi:hypothetical protein